MCSNEVPLVDNLGPYLDSLLEELSKNDPTSTPTDTFVSVETQTDADFASQIEKVDDTSNSNASVVVIYDDDIENAEIQRPADKKKVVRGSVPFYLKDHLNIMCIFILCHINGRGGFQQSWCHLAIFIFLATLALVQTLSVFKDYVLGYAKGGSVLHYITAWYFFHTALVSSWFLKLVLDGEKISNLIKNLDKLLEERVAINHVSHQKISNTVIAAAVLSIISAFAFATRLDVFLVDYDFKQLIEISSVDLSKTILLWTRMNYTEREDYLSFEYGKFDKTPILVGTLGFAEIFIQFVGWLQYFMIKDIMLMAALTLYTHAEVYKAYLKSVKELDLPVLGRIWRSYEFLHKFSGEIEICFGKLFQLVHIDNWLFCAYFLYMYVDPNDIEPVYFTVNLVVVIKVAVMYCLSAKANSVSAKTRNCLQMKSSHIGSGEDNDLKQDIIYMDLKIKISPVGIGSGNFLVHEGFPYKFLGSVASSFLFFLKSDNE